MYINHYAYQVFRSAYHSQQLYQPLNLNSPTTNGKSANNKDEHVRKMFNITFYQKNNEKINISLTTNTQAGDAELNPRSKNASVYPRGLCKVPVTWNCKINIWYHNSCIELCTEDYELLERSNVQYMALQQMQDHKRQHFTFRSYELET